MAAETSCKYANLDLIEYGPLPPHTHPISEFDLGIQSSLSSHGNYNELLTFYILSREYTAGYGRPFEPPSYAVLSRSQVNVAARLHDLLRDPANDLHLRTRHFL